jgi:heme oxygenase
MENKRKQFKSEERNKRNVRYKFEMVQDLTPWDRKLFGKLTVNCLTEKFAAFC